MQTTFSIPSMSWFTAWLEAPKAYFSQIIHYIPNVLDNINTRVHYDTVEIMAWIALITWFIFRLLRSD